MKMEVLGQEITQINRSLSTHTPACPWAVHPPAVRSNTKHPSERPPLRERQSRGGCQCSAHPISKKQEYTGNVVINGRVPNRPWRELIRALCKVDGASELCNYVVCNLTGSVFLGSFRVLEGTKESLAEIHREVLHF